jgi:primosomal protein N' (replication factor Y) (superfamily II helicase)
MTITIPNRYAFVYLEQLPSDRTFFYKIPDGFSGKLQAGSRVLVEFGRGGKIKERLGFIQSLAANPSGEVMGEILDYFDDGSPALSIGLLKLADWLADYYISYPIEALNAMLPAALRIKPKETVVLKAFSLHSPDDENKMVRTELRRKIMATLTKENKLTVRQLERRTGSKHLRPALAELTRIGYLEVKKTYIQTGKAKLKVAYALAKNHSPEQIETISLSLKRSKKQLDAFQKLSYSSQKFSFAEDLGATSAAMQGLIEKGIAVAQKVEVTAAFTDSFREPFKSITLSDAQAKAVRAILEAIEQNQFQTFLLHGVTGSGKTQVYIESIRKILERGQTAIVLVPEISLTPQTAARFRSHFGDNVRVLHSAMNDSEKFEAWQSLKTGKATIALGPRSAVYAPLPNLGLIIVDEEHESSYKQFDVAPRYHARDVAVMRAKFENAVCVLGSATPSVESYHNALSGKYHLLELPDRADGASMPEMKMIAISKDKKVSASITQTLHKEIETTLSRGEQVILFQNRRGYAGSVQCTKCGWVAMCPSCHVSMVYHQAEQHLRCHYCGTIHDMVSQCKRCGSSELNLKSSGTERIEEELMQLFPSEKIIRMDLDTTQKKGSHSKLLSEFQEGKSKILLGTQMVAKGLDFPNVTLVGALFADVGLTLPDFRAGERLYSLLLQVAGRAGRAQKKGEVFLQAFNIDSDIFRHLLQNDYKRFYDYEIKERQMLFYPPFAKLAKIEFTSTSEIDSREASKLFGSILEKILPEPAFNILGPVPAVIAKLKNNYRYQILIKQREGARLQKRHLREVQQEFRTTFHIKSVRITIDIDTQSSM